MWHLLADVVRLTAGGWVALQVVVVLYAVVAHQSFSIVTSSLAGGAFLGFVIIVPAYTILAWAAARPEAG